MNIKKFLDQHEISYKVYEHEKTYDAQHLAAALHVPGMNVAKTVLLRADGAYRYYVFVLPACHRVDLQSVSDAFGGARVRLATEVEIGQLCPDAEFGILPPFGSQIGADTIVDESLANHEDIFFQGDTHTEAIRMKYSDFRSLEYPHVVASGHSPPG